jgi:hypothetical protein
VLQSEARLVYLDFIARVVASREVWSLRCCGDFVVVTGAEAGLFPLWPDHASAEFFSTRHWPGLEPAKLTLRLLLRVYLRELERAGIPVGVGVAPHPDAVVLEAKRLRRDFIAAKRCLAGLRSRARC